MLREEYRVNCATTAAEARVFLRSSVVDLLILDSVLPDGNANDIAMSAETLRVPVIGLTSHNGGALKNHICLKKPFSVDTMLAEVRSALGQHIAIPA